MGHPQKRLVKKKEWTWYSQWAFWKGGTYKTVSKKKWVRRPPWRKAIGKIRIKEELIFALPPGDHKLEIRSKVQVDKSHPIMVYNKFEGLIDWIKLAMNPIEVIADKIANKIMIRNLIKNIAIKEATEATTRYVLHIPAVMPNLIGKDKKEAYTRVKQWSLTPKFGMVKTINKNKHNRVKSQSPAAGTLLKAGTTVRFDYYAYQSPPTTTARYSKTSYKGILESDWTISEFGFGGNCRKTKGQNEWICNWSNGCSDSQFKLKSHSTKTGKIIFDRTDLTCNFSKGLKAEYECTLVGDALKDCRRKITHAGSGKVRPTKLLNQWHKVTIQKK